LYCVIYIYRQQTATAVTQPHQPKATRKDATAAAWTHQKGMKTANKVTTRAAVTSWAETSESSGDSTTVRRFFSVA
jgi:hypothetical protein